MKKIRNIGIILCLSFLCACGKSVDSGKILQETTSEEKQEIEQENLSETIEGIYTCDADADDTYKTYADKEALLTAYGFLGAEPFFQYYNESDQIHMELYWDEQRDIGCGIRYVYSVYRDGAYHDELQMYGFGFQGHSVETWDRDLFSTLSVDGDTGASAVDDYEELCEYTEDGKLDYYVSSGVIDWLRDSQPERANVLEIDFIYRDDGTLAQREYTHNSWIFGTTFTTLSSYFDENERLTYEVGYITHGFLELYYIYEDESSIPTYCLCLDSIGWSMWTDFICYQ